MMGTLGSVTALLTVLSLAQAPAQVDRPALTEPLKAPCPAFVYAAEGDGGWILRFNRQGKIDWSFRAPMSRDVWQLPGGNVLFAFNQKYDPRGHDNPSGVMEVSPAGKVVWRFDTKGQVWACQRLADGNTLIGAASQGKVLIVSPAGKIVREVRVRNAPGHSCMRHARALADGTILVAEESAKAIRQYDPQGRFVREMTVPFPPFSVCRLSDGHTLTSGKTHLVELDQAGKIVWSLDGKDYPELGVRWLAGLQVLPNGNIFCCNAGGKVGFIEFSRDKKVAWASNDKPIHLPAGHGVHLLP